MALTDYKITTADLNDKGVMGLPRVPGYSTAEMQHRFDEIAKDVIIPKYNALIEALLSVIPISTLTDLQNGDGIIYDSVNGVFINSQNITSIEKLQDVDSTSPFFNGAFLRYDLAQRKWVPSSSSVTIPSLDSIEDVSATNPNDGDLLLYDAANHVWINSKTLLSLLTDVTITLPQEGDLFAFDYTAGKWKNVKNTALETVTDLQKTKVVAVPNTGWATSGDYVTRAFTFTKIVGNPIIKICDANGDVETDEAKRVAYCSLFDAVVTNSTTLTLYATEVPATGFNILVTGAE